MLVEWVSGWSWNPHWKRQQDEGVSHVALNIKPLQRPAADVLEEMAEYVLPHFPIGQSASKVTQ
ncbi:hypothetical protein BKM17_27310 [Pseudomonas syringae group genomosp. 3]|nr:hypothetical protein BKM17_27310 [Pseudomonas syringae group genomosp. 3]